MARFLAAVLSVGVLWWVAGVSIAREPRTGRTAKASPAPVATAASKAREPVPDVLEAQAQGLVSVRYIPNDSRSAQIIVTNRSRRPLTLRLPAAFAGVPVLAQFQQGGMGGNNNNLGGFGAAGQPQVAGGGGLGGQGMNGMGGMGGMQGGGGGAFSIPAEKTRVLRVVTVCLEHGKPEPSSRYPYKLTALESFSNDPKLAVVMESLSRGELSQKVAQAAAWHIANGLSWQQLAAKMIDHAGGDPDEAYFTPEQLLVAHRVVASATQAALQRKAGSQQPPAIANESAASASVLSAAGPAQ